MNDNLWHRIFISTLAHCAAGDKDPWVIPEGKFKATLQEIWDAVYKDSIEHTVVSGGPVYQLVSLVSYPCNMCCFYLLVSFHPSQAKQGLNNWRAGFATAAVTIITAFFANDAEFDDPDQQAEFAVAMVKKNHFLFSQNRGLDIKVYYIPFTGADKKIG